MTEFDFISCDARLVRSISTNSRPLLEWRRIQQMGLGRLEKIIQDFQMKPIAGGHVLEMRGSSAAACRSRWLQTIHLIASGHRGRDHQIQLDFVPFTRPSCRRLCQQAVAD